MITINILSLFDGMSCGQIALERAGIKVENYFASEIDKYAIKVTMKNYPNTIQLGNIYDIDFTQFKGKIDIGIGGSPCTYWSIAKKDRETTSDGIGFELFTQYVRAIKESEVKYFLYENNYSIHDDIKKEITKYLGVEPIMINSSLVSAQNRKRLYWTNIPNITQPEDKGIFLKDIIDNEVYEYSRKTGVGKKLMKSIPILASDWRGLNRNQKQNAVCIQVGEADLKGQDIIKRVYSIEGKSPTLTTMQGGHREPKIALNDKEWRALIPLEMERLQTVPDNYTDGVSNTQRKKMLGNGWTVDVIAHILSYIK